MPLRLESLSIAADVFRKFSTSFTVYIYEEVSLSSDFGECFQDHYPFDDQRACGVVQARFHDALKVSNTPKQRVAVLDQLKIEMNCRRAYLPCEPRGERRLSDAVGAIDGNQQRGSFGP
jgi:hypothetical protein